MISTKTRPKTIDEYIRAAPKEAQKKLREMHACIRAAAVTAFAKQLSKFSTAKGSIQFPLEKPLPLSLVRKITAFRVKESVDQDKKWRT